MMNASQIYTNDTLATSRKPAAIIAPAIAQPLIAVGSILYVRPPHIAQPT